MNDATINSIEEVTNETSIVHDIDTFRKYYAEAAAELTRINSAIKAGEKISEGDHYLLWKLTGYKTAVKAQTLVK